MSYHKDNNSQNSSQMNSTNSTQPFRNGLNVKNFGISPKGLNNTGFNFNQSKKSYNSEFRSKSDFGSNKDNGPKSVEELGITGLKMIKEPKRNSAVYNNINRAGSIKLKERKERIDILKNYSQFNGIFFLNLQK